jgi:hypothetical protein
MSLQQNQYAGANTMARIRQKDKRRLRASLDAFLDDNGKYTTDAYLFVGIY